MMSAVCEFQEALYREQDLDKREIIGVRVSSSFFDRLREECQPIVPGDGQYLGGPKICGIPIFIHLSQDISFDHLD
jgi:hypothetical protein